MSKTLGNVIDPIDTIKEYGTDALRFTLSLGTAGQFVLSQKFYQNVYSSPFPIDTGKRAANFSAWLHKQENDLKEDGIYLDIDLQCAEIFHLFALVSSEELFVSPCLPSEGIGEADEKKNLKCMSAEDKQICGDKALKHQYLWKKDNEPCNRREKGFPGIRLLLNRAKIPIPEAVEVLIEKERNISPPRYAGKYRESCFNQETVEAPFQNGSDSYHEIINNFNIASTKVILNESLWEAMAGYAEHLSSTVDWNQEAIFSPDVIKFIYSAIHQAGEQGLNMVEISEAINMQGNQFAEIAVDILEEFQLIIKVNAYDCVRAVDSSYKSKYFITTLVDQGHSPVPQSTNHVASQRVIGSHESVCGAQMETHMDLCNGQHEVMVHDLAEEHAEFCRGDQPPVHTQSLGCDTLRFPLQSRPILPWINGDGSTNSTVYRGLVRRVLGIVMQSPGMLEEDLIKQMGVLNPQSCRQLLQLMVLDNHITVRKMHQTTCSTPPAMLAGLFRCCPVSESVFRKHLFANPKSTSLL